MVPFSMTMNDLLTQISRSRHYLKVNIAETVHEASRYTNNPETVTENTNRKSHTIY